MGRPSLSKYSHFTDDELVRLVATDPGAYFDAEGEIVRRIVADEWRGDEHQHEVETLEGEVGDLKEQVEALANQLDESRQEVADSLEEIDAVRIRFQVLQKGMERKEVAA